MGEGVFGVEGFSIADAAIGGLSGSVGVVSGQLLLHVLWGVGQHYLVSHDDSLVENQRDT